MEEKIKSQSRSWLLTQSSEKISFEDLRKALENYVYIAKEEKGVQGGEQGYEHYHIYIENPVSIYFATLKNKLPNAHIEPRMGTRKQAYDYVTKEVTGIGEVFGNGEIDINDEKGKRNDIAEIMQMVEDNASDEEIRKAYPAQFFKHFRNIDMLRQFETKKKSKGWRKITCVYIQGETRSGKTRYVMDKYSRDQIYRTTEYEFGWIDGYRGEKILVLDEFRSFLKISQFLDYTDGYVERIHGRNYPRNVCYDTVYVISNWKLHEQYPNMKTEKPEDWKAFLARFDEVYEFRNGVAHQVHPPQSPQPKSKQADYLADLKPVEDESGLPF